MSPVGRPTSAALAVFAILLFGIPAQAAGNMQLLKLRDADHPGLCDLEPGDGPYTGIERVVLAGTPRTTLLVVPCLATASSLFHVVFVEDGGLPRPLYFAIPDLDPPDDNDWSKARMTQIRVTAMISSPNIDKATGTINTATLIAPGLGTGVLRSHTMSGTDRLPWYASRLTWMASPRSSSGRRQTCGEFRRFRRHWSVRPAVNVPPQGRPTCPPPSVPGRTPGIISLPPSRSRGSGRSCRA